MESAKSPGGRFCCALAGGTVAPAAIGILRFHEEPTESVSEGLRIASCRRVGGHVVRGREASSTILILRQFLNNDCFFRRFRAVIVAIGANLILVDQTVEIIAGDAEIARGSGLASAALI